MNKEYFRRAVRLARGLALTVGLAGAVTLAGSPALAGDDAQRVQGADDKAVSAAKKPDSLTVPRSSLLTVQDWQKAPLKAIQPGEIDQLIGKALSQDKIAPAPLTTDEQFIRRATLDLTGALPAPADVTEFVADNDPGKRAKLIDKLLDSDEYAKHWARYWRDVIAARLTERRALGLSRSFEEWLSEQLKNNVKWDKIVKAMVTADGPARFDSDGENGAAFFLMAHRGADSATERAAEAARIFLGIQVQCAQCHDHPTDQWKRVQFHELAAYFARLGDRPIRDGQRLMGFNLISVGRGEHQMPSKEDPKKSFVTNPSFLDGKAAGTNLGDKERRNLLAKAIVHPNNYWFAAAFVNRIWGQLEGQAFCQPVDDMGPNKDVVFPEVLTRLTGSFRASEYDVKGLLRDIMNSQSYQRQLRVSESGDQHTRFAASQPTRLRPNALYQSLVNVLGALTFPGQNRRPRGIFGQGFGFDFAFKEEFDFDPSLKADDVEGSISQALLMMNNSLINQKIQARGTNLLSRILKSYPDNDEVIRMVYLRALARKPTDRELQKCHDYVAKTSDRTEAFEDILWTLLNSTEFQTKR
jgi:hypothetical protein